MKSKLIWKDNMAFYGVGEHSPNEIITDATKGAGGNEEGPSPMELLLLSLASCASIDVMMILNKRRKQVDDYWVEITGERRDEPPKYYESIHMTFHIKGQDITEKEIERALELAESTYCSVWSNIDPDKTTISYDYVIHD